MGRNTISLLSSLFIFLFSCTPKEEVERITLQSQVLNDELLTTMPGDLILAGEYLIWSDPFAHDSFLHVHDASTGEEIVAMGKVGKGPKEFVIISIYLV